jgi:ABC-2 type transport system permease protein
LSVGIQPAERFPEWIQPIVRNQPVSQLVYALRALAGDTTPAAVPVTWSVLAPSFAWLAAMVLITVPLAMRAYLRRP